MKDDLPSITSAFSCRSDCWFCHGEGIVCEEHPNNSWPHDGCGGAGEAVQSVEA
jgi:hypothetical protein